MSAPHTGAPLPWPHATEPDGRPRLSDRELVILQVLASGYSLSQCAQLTRATGTETLAAAQGAARKLGVQNATAAAFDAHRLGLVV